MDTKLATRQVRIQQWAGIIRSRADSGLTINEYCAANNLSPNQYYYWLRRVREAALEESGFQFVEIPQIEEATPSQSGEGLQIQIGKISVNNVTEGTSRDLLKMIMEVAADV